MCARPALLTCARTCWYVRVHLTQTQHAWCNTGVVSGDLTQRLGWMAVCQGSLILGEDQ